MENNHGNNQEPPTYSQPLQTASSNPQMHQYGIEQMENFSDFKNRQLPLARIKKIMKADPDVHMVAAEAPILFAKACEMFIIDLTRRSWLRTDENKRLTLQKSDISDAVASSFTYDFLQDLVPKDAADPPGFVAMPHPVGEPQYSYSPEMFALSPAAAVEGEEAAGANGGNGGGN